MPNFASRLMSRQNNPHGSLMAATAANNSAQYAKGALPQRQLRVDQAFARPRFDHALVAENRLEESQQVFVGVDAISSCAACCAAFAC